MWFLTDPVIALFISLSLGYLIGGLKVGPVQLGGSAERFLSRSPWDSLECG